jgi:hypothetical protein
MKIEKWYAMTFSHQFPNGDIASIKLGTGASVDSVLDSASDKDIAKFSAHLAKKVYKSTVTDLGRLVKNNEAAAAIMESIESGVTGETADDEALKVLMGLPDDES